MQEKFCLPFDLAQENWYSLHFYASSKGSDEPAQKRSLSRAFAAGIYKEETLTKAKAKIQLFSSTK